MATRRALLEGPIAPPSTSRSRFLTVAGSLAAVATVGVLLPLLFVEPRSPQRMRFGTSELTLLGVTVGTRHRLITGRPWQRLALALFPNWQLAGAEIFEDQQRKDALEVWVRKRGGSGSGDSDSTLVTIDEHGCRFPPCKWLLQRASSANPAEEVYRPCFPAYPRRGGRVRCSGYSPETDREDSLAFSLPRRQEFPTWRPEPYPIVRRVGGTEFTLEDVAPTVPDVLTGAFTTELRFRMRNVDGSPGGWQADRVVIRDATGNEAVTEMAGTMHPERAPVYGLCQHEPAWKLHVEFVPSEPIRLLPDYVWTCRVPVPAAGQFASVGASFSRPRACLELLGVAGKGLTNWPDGLFEGRTRVPRVGFRVLPQSPPFRLELLATRAGNGPWKETIARENRTWTWCNCADRVGPHFELPDVRGPIELRLGIHTTRSVEFLAKPRAE